jgi:hypothetical protein
MTKEGTWTLFKGAFTKEEWESMIAEPRVSTEVAGHGDIRDGIFIECDTAFEVAWLLTWLTIKLKGINEQVPKV